MKIDFMCFDAMVASFRG